MILKIISANDTRAQGKTNLKLNWNCFHAKAQRGEKFNFQTL
jgi:hypothetical protein